MTSAQIQEILTAIRNLGGAAAQVSGSAYASLVRQQTINGWEFFAGAVVAFLFFAGCMGVLIYSATRREPTGQDDQTHWNDYYIPGVVIGLVGGLFAFIFVAFLATSAVSDILNPQGQVVQNILCNFAAQSCG